MKKGFTLAEVLITLGIIGIVAALTLPTLISNHKKQVYVTQLKKTLSTVEQGVRLMLANDGVDRIEDTALYSEMRSNAALTECCPYGDYMSDEACIKFYNEFGKYFNISKFDKAVGYKVLPGFLPTPPNDPNAYDDFSEDYFYFLNDGSLIRVDAIPGASNTTSDHQSFSYSTLLMLDVNGTKGPNMPGYDVFDVAISDNGKLYYDVGLTEHNIAKIIKDGWKITY